MDVTAVRECAFADATLLGTLESVVASGELERLDELDFGLIVMDRLGVVQHYNAVESARAGLRASRVVGRNFFADVGPCTNNYLVAERFHEAAESRAALDGTLPYVFTFVMRPTPVWLRLLAAAGSPRQYLAIRNRGEGDPAG